MNQPLNRNERAVKRSPGVQVRPGAVRRARLEAGLSLAGLAGNYISRSAIHLIETGQSRPSRRTLEWIASRTGKPVSFFLAPAGSGPGSFAVELEDLERSFLGGQYGRVVETGEELLPTLYEPESEAWVQLLIGQAHVQLNRPGMGWQHLSRAQELFRSQADPWKVAECMAWQAQAAQLDDDHRARSLAEKAVAEARGLDPVPPATEAHALIVLGSVLAADEPEQAGQALREAITAAHTLASPRAMTAFYDELVAAYRRAGKANSAAIVTSRAIGLRRLEQDWSLIVLAEMRLGSLLWSQGDMEGAAEHLERALAQCRRFELDRSLGEVLLALGGLHLARGDHRAAADLAGQAIRSAEAHDDRLTLALAYELEGRLADAEHVRARTDEKFGRAIELLSEVGATQRLIECHKRYAEILEARGDTRRALQEWKVAARLAMQGGDRLERP
jgi:HTH-type transcriptional regulator, quorum sensing regulator NprR